MGVFLYNSTVCFQVTSIKYHLLRGFGNSLWYQNHFCPVSVFFLCTPTKGKLIPKRALASCKESRTRALFSAETLS